MSRRIAAVLVVVPLLLAAAWRLRGGPMPVGPLHEAGRPPRIAPDYTGITLPPNIAPLNFVVTEPGRHFAARLSGDAGPRIGVAGRGASICIPIGPWRKLLAANRGRDIRVDIYSADAAGRWTHFDTIRNRVAPDPVDSTLVYRRLGPVFNLWTYLGIYQRDLESFAERPVLRNRKLRGACLNCHTFLQNRPDTFLFHTRPGKEPGPGPGMVVVQGGKARRIDTKAAGAGGAAVYSAWHPDGRLVAFSVNTIRQFFHTAGAEPRDVVDLASGIALYSLDTGRATTAIDRPDRLETFPTWAPDGKALYFSSAPALWPSGTVPRFDIAPKIHYDLMRATFHPETGRFDAPELIVPAGGKSIVEARVSPEGRFLLATRCRYGAFPIMQEESDLILVDLNAKGFPWHRVEEAPASLRDSWHCWSSSGRWIVFSRKKENPLLARPHLRYIDADGNASKAFVVPQEDPTTYGRCLDTFNAPELVKGPVTISEKALAQAALGQ